MRARVALALVLGFALLSTGVAYYLTSTATGTLAIRIHDSPASWSQLKVTFSEVAVHPANAADDSGWVVLNLAERQIDFLALGNLTRLLAVDRIAPGAYTEIRIVVTSVQGVLSGGAPVTMSVPDGVAVTATSFNLLGGGTTTITIDLDLAQSVQQANGVWTFTPILGLMGVT